MLHIVHAPYCLYSDHIVHISYSIGAGEMRLLVVAVMLDMIATLALPEDELLTTIITVTLMPVLLGEDKVTLMPVLLGKDTMTLIPVLLEKNVVTEMPVLLVKDIGTEMPALLEEDHISSNPVMVAREGKRGVNTSHRLR